MSAAAGPSGPLSAPSSNGKPAPTRTFWPPSDWSLRRKVAAALALPLIFATVLVGLRVAGAWSDAQAATNAHTHYGALEPAISYLATSQDLATENIRNPIDTKAQGAARTAQGKAAKSLQSALDRSSLTGHQRNLLSSAIATGKTLTSPDAVHPDTAAQTAATISSDVLGFIDDLASKRPDTMLNALHDLVTAQSHLSDQRVSVISATKIGDLGAQFAADVGGEQDALERVQAAHLAGVDVSAAQSATVARLAFSTDGTLSQMTTATPSVQTSYRAPYEAAVKDALLRVSHQAADSKRTALEQIALLLALLVITVLLALLISRNLLVQPIARLRRSTLDVANEELPAAIARVQAGQGVGRIKSVALTNREEIGQLSRAIDGMQNRAIRLAGEQATLRRQMTDMFETLSRRSTSLVNQQLNLLEQLERGEDDSARLDSLFRLDHMAARMRRNGQSLMVLAGNEGHRAAGRPLAIGQVIGAAISEVQDYQRVGVGQLPDQVVAGEVATDLVHVIAELVDNALAYSPPDSQVTISSARALDGGVLIEIEDRGLGIEADELARLNEDLDEGGRFGVETTRRMGLFVVGRLGQTHDIEIRLRSKLQQGTVAAVQVPLEAMSDDAVVPETGAWASHDAGAEAPVAAAASTVAMPSATLTPVTLAPGSPATSTSSGAATPSGADDVGANPPGPTLTGAGLPRRQPGTNRAGIVPMPTVAETPEPVTEIADSEQPLPRRVPTRDIPVRARAEDSPTTPVTTTPERARGASAFFSGSKGARPATPTPPAAPPISPPTPRVEDTPIFREISSRWLDADGRHLMPWTDEPTDRAWAAARAATDSHDTESDDGALPRRRPGLYVVPGRVDQQEPGSAGVGRDAFGSRSAGLRDPEAVRSKLSRYKAGVERARLEALSGGESSDQDDQDNGSRKW